MRKTILVIILLLGPLFSLKAQSFDASQWTQGVTTITAPWRFHPGDDPAWASPTFDDSAWPLLVTNREWQDQGYGGLRGYAWYRMRLKLPATTQPLAFDTGWISSAGELYVDGKFLGTNGIMRPKPDWSNHQRVDAFPLPVSCNGRCGRHSRMENPHGFQQYQRRPSARSGRRLAPAPAGGQPCRLR